MSEGGRERERERGIKHTFESRVKLIVEFLPPDTRPAATGTRRISALDHKVANDAVEHRVVVVAAPG